MKRITYFVLAAMLLAVAAPLAVADPAASQQHNESVTAFSDNAATADIKPIPADPVFDRYVPLDTVLAAFHAADALLLAEYAVAASETEQVLLRNRNEMKADALWEIARRMAVVTDNAAAMNILAAGAKRFGKTDFQADMKAASGTAKDAAADMTIRRSPVFAISVLNGRTPDTAQLDAAYDLIFPGKEIPKAEFKTRYQRLAKALVDETLSANTGELLARAERRKQLAFAGMSDRLVGAERNRGWLPGSWVADGGRSAAIDQDGYYTAYTPVGWNVFTYRYDPYDNHSGYMEISNSDGFICGRVSVYFHGPNCMEWIEPNVMHRIYYRK